MGARRCKCVTRRGDRRRPVRRVPFGAPKIPAWWISRISMLARSSEADGEDGVDDLLGCTNPLAGAVLVVIRATKRSRMIHLANDESILGAN